MDKFNEWINVQLLADNGLETWCKIDTLDDEQYLKVQYRDRDGKIIDKTHDYPVRHIKNLNNIIDVYNAKTRHPHVDFNKMSR